MKRREFLRQYVKHTRTVGAVAPSSRFLADRMVGSLKASSAATVVELGAGTGVFTAEIVRHIGPKARLLVIEVNERFADELTQRHKSQGNIEIIHGTAEDLTEILAERGLKQVDYIISGLPFASLSASVSHRILASTVAALAPSGVFTTFQYTPFKLGLLRRYFNSITPTYEVRNIPPAFVLTCRNVPSTTKSN